MLFLCYIVSFLQIVKYNLVYKNLHKKVKNPISHYYTYDKKSGGFVKKPLNIENYDIDGKLIETYSLYDSAYPKTSNPVKRLYQNNKKDKLTFIKDISDKRGKYSSNKTFTL